MKKYTIGSREYSLTELSNRWRVAVSTASRTIKKVGLEKAEAFYSGNMSLDGEVYSYKHNVKLSDGNSYTVGRLSKITGLCTSTIHYLIRTSESTEEFERKLKKATDKKSGASKTYTLSKGQKLSLSDLSKLWGVTERSIERYIIIHGIETTEKHYTEKLRLRMRDGKEA